MVFKNLITATIAGILLCSASFAQTADKDAIKKICTAESQAYHDHDYNAFVQYHVQSADEQLAWNNPDGSYGFQTGWDSIGKGIKEWFQNEKKEDVKVVNDHFIFTIHNDMAFVAYNSNVQSASGKTTKLREYRTLLLTKGQWKILAVEAYIDHHSGK